MEDINRLKEEIENYKRSIKAKEEELEWYKYSENKAYNILFECKRYFTSIGEDFSVESTVSQIEDWINNSLNNPFHRDEVCENNINDCVCENNINDCVNNDEVC